MESLANKEAEQATGGHLLLKVLIRLVPGRLSKKKTGLSFESRGGERETGQL